MKAALLGFSQAGKRSLFELLTGRSVAVRKEGEVVEAVGQIRDPRVDEIARMAQPERIKYAEVQVSLCPDLTIGSGKRDWLDAARKCELVCVVIREFSSGSVFHPKGSVDASRDRSDIESELILADLELVEKRLERIGKEKRSGQTPAQALEEKSLGICRAWLEKGGMLNALTLEPHEGHAVENLGLVTMRPVLWVYNVDEDQVARSHAAESNVFVVSCQIEREIMAIESADERRDYMKTIGLEASGLDRMMAVAYDAMGLMSFYTMGPDEVRAWTVRKGSTAPVAAGKIHTDFERGFIRVEVIKYDDLVEAGSEADVKAQGKAQTRGKDYVMQDGDICHFRFNV